MKKFGIIGGAGPLASSLLYESIVHDFYQNGGTIPEMIILNFPFTRCLTKDEKTHNDACVLKELYYCITSLEQHGVDIGLLACNTLHLFLRMLPSPIVEFKSLPELVLQEAKKKKAQSLLILGSQNSCRLKLYQDPSIAMVYPSEEEQQTVDRVIDRVLQGVISIEDSLSLSQLIFQIESKIKFDGVVLGCTDLPVLHHRHPLLSPCPIYDSIKIASTQIRSFI